MTTAAIRRSLLAGAGAVIMGSGITAGAAASVADLIPASSDDAYLVAIGAEGRQITAHYDRLLTQWWSLKSGDPEITSCAAKMDGPHNRMCELSDLATEVSASTPEGWQAKAVLIRFLMTVEHGTKGRMEFETSDQELMWSLICDMTGSV